MNEKSGYWVQAIRASGGLGSVDRINEVLFGLIMVLTFTCSISAASAGTEEVSTVLWGALGCNIAWGFVDAFMYLFAVLLERGESFQNVRHIRNTSTPTEMNQAVKEALPFGLRELLREEHISFLGQEIKNLPDPPAKVSLTTKDLRDAVAIFFLVFFSTFPVTLPFILIDQLHLAIRISNLVALILLFLTGVYLAKRTGRRKIATGISFAVIGSILVSATMALGG